MTWEQVVNYVFLSDFDLLCDGHKDIQEQPWVKLAGQIAMDMYFKMEHADKEISYLNLEIPCLFTYMCDKEVFLWWEARIVADGREALVHQVFYYRMHQGRFNDEHICHLFKLMKMPSFTASMAYGIPINKECLQGHSMSPASTTISLPASDTSCDPNSPHLTTYNMPEGPADFDSDDDDNADVLLKEFILLSVMEDRNGDQLNVQHVQEDAAVS
ncbi:hypothetical protein C8R44DRAFT_642757 [Mycena epipterygia]|nr:hypothetical protein C8R44DRAFT_642757 [Mycena epipterygia]